MAERNTYMKYKEGTSKIAGWLVETARRCGVDVEPHITYRHRPTSSNAGTGAGQQTTLRIRIKSFTFLATRIAESDIQLPKIIAWLIRKVIKLRKEADEAFARASKGLGPRDIGHRYFIRVLEEVYEILQSRSTHANSDGWEVAYGTASPEPKSPSCKSLTLQGDDTNPDDDVDRSRNKYTTETHVKASSNSIAYECYDGSSDSDSDGNIAQHDRQMCWHPAI